MKHPASPLRFLPLLFVLFFITIPPTQAQSDLPRQSVAITYPLDQSVTVKFRGTTLLPRLKGEAKVRRAGRRGTRVELSVEDLPRASELGGVYTTYVLWAISPEGRVDNLGEIKRGGSFLVNSKLDVTTPLQTFALILTAEPHFLVRGPSRMVVLENLPPQKPGDADIATVNVQYLGNTSDYFKNARVPDVADDEYRKTPVSLLGARQAINLARYAGAPRDAADELREAQDGLEQAENAWRLRQSEAEIDAAARRAISLGVRAEEVAETRKAARQRREEITRRDEAIRSAEENTANATQQIRDLRSALVRELLKARLVTPAVCVGFDHDLIIGIVCEKSGKRFELRERSAGQIACTHTGPKRLRECKLQAATSLANGTVASQRLFQSRSIGAHLLGSLCVSLTSFLRRSFAFYPWQFPCLSRRVIPMSKKCCLIFCSVLLVVVVAVTPGSPSLARSHPQSTQAKVSLHLRWAGQQGVLRYRLQLAHDEQFKDIVFDRAVYGTEYVVTELGPGRYFWRVAPAVKETGAFSNPRAVEIGEDATTAEVAPTPTPPLLPMSNTGWRTTTGSIAQPLVAHLRSTSSSDLVGVNADGMVYGVDGGNGVALWSARFRPNAKRGEQTGNGGAMAFTPILIDGANGLANVVVAFDGGVRALDGGTGREVWRAPLKNRAAYGALAIASGGGAKTLLIASNDSPSLTVLKSENGEVISETTLDGPLVAAPAAFPLAGESGVALPLEGGMVDVRNSRGERVRSVKMDTKITTPPLVVVAPRGTIVLIGTESGLISLSAEDLKPIGRIATESDAPAGTLAAADLDGDGAPEVFMLTRRGRLVAVGSTDGKIKWYTSGATDAGSTAFADLNGDGVLDVIVAAGQDFARGFSGRDGILLWKAEGESGGAPTAPSANQTRSLVAGTFGDGSTVLVVGTDTARTGLRAIGLPKNSVKAAKE